MTSLCQLCGEPMPEGEEMFHYHGYSGPCPKPPLKEEKGLTVIEEIAAERKRQIEVEGWTAEHDDQHTMKELADAASCYATNTPYNWPNSWSICWWKPTDHRRNLVKAAALIVAEIERLDREEAKKVEFEQRLESVRQQVAEQPASTKAILGRKFEVE